MNYIIFKDCDAQFLLKGVDQLIIRTTPVGLGYLNLNPQSL